MCRAGNPERLERSNEKSPPLAQSQGGDISHLASRSMAIAGGFQLDELDPDSGGLIPGLTHLMRKHLDGQGMP